MSNGIAFVLDDEGDFRTRVNQELVGLEQVTTPEYIELLEAMIRRHLELTGSRRAQRILGQWRLYLPKFWKVVPKFALTEEGPMTVVRRHLEGLRRRRGLGSRRRSTGFTTAADALGSAVSYSYLSASATATREAARAGSRVIRALAP